MKVIGKYGICGLLGRGGMSRVYKVKLPVIDKIAALKRLEPDPLLADLIGESRLRELFIGEARALAGIRHENVVSVLGYEEIDARPCYLMEYYCNNLGIIMGETYRAEAPSRILPVARALHYVRQILEGMACLHHEEIIHRDIKPFNILITDRDSIRICDFGLSKLRGEKFAGPPNLKVGSPWYAAPEQETDPDSVDFRADLYPVGVMLYRMLTGHLPSKNFEPPSRLNTDLDAAWDRFIAKSLAFYPADRFADAEQMRNALEKVAQQWNARKEAICELPQASPEKPSTGPDEPSRPRQGALKIGLRQASMAFGLDRLWRPSAYTANRFRTLSEAMLTDLATGLTWQTAGSAYPLTWQRAHQYVRQLNAAEFGGSRGWRLPTVDELLSLLKQVPRGRDHCLEAVFNPLQNRLWSCDRKSFGAAWYVDADLGFIHWQDFGCRNYAKAVRSSRA